MSSKQRNWFFTSPPSTAGDRFVRNNIPSEQTYRNLLDSIALKLEINDTAREGGQGLVKLATDAEVMSRTSMASGEMQTVTRPHQLPLMIIGVAEVDTVDTAIQGDGLKLTLKEITAGDYKRYSTKIELDPINLDIAVPALGDYIIFSDTDDNDLPKRALFTSLADPYWSHDDEGIIPTTANDSVNIGHGDFRAGDIILDILEGVDRHIGPDTPVAGAGTDLYIAGGSSPDPLFTGGDLVLYGGDDVFKDSGSVYIAPGLANVGGVTGNVFLGYTKAGVKRERLE